MEGPHIEHIFLQLLLMSEFIRVSLNVYIGMCVCVSNTHELLSWAKVLCQLYELCVKVANTKTEPTKLNLIAPSLPSSRYTITVTLSFTRYLWFF